MKQARLAGRTKGLRPKQQRQLERLSHRRHPERLGADQLTLERLSEQVQELNQPLHMVLDSRGLCRLVWVGPLVDSVDLIAHLPEAPRRKIKDWRLISCLLPSLRDDLRPEPQESIVGFDLAPLSWLRFSSTVDRRGHRPAALWGLDPSELNGWSLLQINHLSELCENFQGSISIQRPLSQSSASSEERVLMLTLTGKDLKRSERELAELEGLVRSAGARPVAVVRQKQDLLNSQTIWGTGKLQESALAVRRSNASLVITDRELSPVQVRNLERHLDCPVMDRSELILDIFAQRASSAAGRLQVELAQLRYRMPRLRGRGRSLSRQGGGIGTRGPGETQLEKDRRAIARRIERLLRQVRKLQDHRARLRERRRDLPRVALVGYTNAGKSSLLNALCGRNEHSKVLSENKLFATLDPTTRRLTFAQGEGLSCEILITDTVGFIRELPSPLLEAFRATLEETLAADLLLVVVDLADHDWRAQLDTVHHLLDGLGANSMRQVVANQIDRCELSELERIGKMDEKVLYLSATSGAGLQGLKSWLQDHFWGIRAESAKGLLSENKL